MILPTCLHLCAVLKFFCVYRQSHNSNSIFMMFHLVCLESLFDAYFFSQYSQLIFQIKVCVPYVFSESQANQQFSNIIKLLFKNIFHVDLLYVSKNLYSFWRYDYKFYIKLRMYLISKVTIPTVFSLCFIWCGFSLSILLDSSFWCIFL